MLRSLFAATLSILVASATAAEVDRTKLVEASTNFDQESVEPFLIRVADLVQSGFNKTDATRLATLIGEMEVEQSKTWEFSVSFQGEATPLVVEAFQDDHEAPDLYFFTSKNLAVRIDTEMKSFAEELGQ